MTAPGSEPMAGPADPGLDAAVDLDLDQATGPDDGAPRRPATPPTGRRKAVALSVRVFGIAIALVALGLCAKALINAWPTVSLALKTANIWWLVVAVLASALSMVGLAILWHRVLAAFDRSWPFRKVAAWYFAGELGKYLPGGIWPVVGRGELARRDGVKRSTAYATTLLALALMCVGAAFACGLLAPFLALDEGGLGPEMLLLILIPIGLICAHPKVSRPTFALLAKFTKGRVRLTPPSWGRMVGLMLAATPTWLLIGGASVAVTAALGYEQHPARVAFAAILAWIVGFLIVPVPAGAGVRELLFVAVCGLAAGPAVAVAAIARLTFIVLDGIGGVSGLLSLRRDRSDASAPDSTWAIPPS